MGSNLEYDEELIYYYFYENGRYLTGWGDRRILDNIGWVNTALTVGPLVKFQHKILSLTQIGSYETQFKMYLFLIFF